jgi:hypothetical protein
VPQQPGIRARNTTRLGVGEVSQAGPGHEGCCAAQHLQLRMERGSSGRGLPVKREPCLSAPEEMGSPVEGWVHWCREDFHGSGIYDMRHHQSHGLYMQSGLLSWAVRASMMWQVRCRARTSHAASSRLSSATAAAARTPAMNARGDGEKRAMDLSPSSGVMCPSDARPQMTSTASAQPPAVCGVRRVRGL